MGYRHQGGSHEERDASLCADAECTVKKNSSTLDRSKPPFVETLIQQEDGSYTSGDAAACGQVTAHDQRVGNGRFIFHQSLSIMHSYKPDTLK